MLHGSLPIRGGYRAKLHLRTELAIFDAKYVRVSPGEPRRTESVNETGPVTPFASRYRSTTEAADAARYAAAGYTPAAQPGTGLSTVGRSRHSIGIAAANNNAAGQS
jgi:hypothetical protein